MNLSCDNLDCVQYSICHVSELSSAEYVKTALNSKQRLEIIAVIVLHVAHKTQNLVISRSITEDG